MNNKVELGQYFTVVNPFKNEAFNRWIDLFYRDNLKFIEPFAGSNNIVKMIQEIGFDNEWGCYDIDPHSTKEMNGYIVQQNDSLKNFPEGYDVAITNPPYLYKSSAKRKGIEFPNDEYDDLYKISLNVMLKNLKYVAAIIPESFLTSNLFHDRLYAVVSLTCRMFNDTECPVCLALFIDKETKKKLKLNEHNFYLYKQNTFINTYEQIKDTINIESNVSNEWKMNDATGNIGIKCIDNTVSRTIEFVEGNTIESDKIKISSRSLTRVSGLPEEIDLNEFLDCCNNILASYRENSSDFFLTSFKGLRADNEYRRRLDFKTAKDIMNKALEVLGYDKEE